LEQLALPGVTVQAGYQFDAEDAVLVGQHPVVVFVDAATEGPAPFALARVKPAVDTAFSSHGLTPGIVLGLARDCFGWQGEAWVLGIRGRSFEPFVEGLTPEAATALEAALAFLVAAIGGGTFTGAT
jgi:hydrogenase maturation protease